MSNNQPQEGNATVAVEKKTSKIPSMVYLCAGLSALAASACMMCRGRKSTALLVGTGRGAQLGILIKGAEALERALARGKPEIFNSDQGAQFTSPRHTKILELACIQISMDGKGRAIDNVFVERLWRSLKYEEVYLKDYETVQEAKDGIKIYFDSVVSQC